MPAAASISQAIAFCNGNATRANVASALLSTMVAWDAAWGVVVSGATPAERTVRNWAVESQLIEANTPTTGTIQQVQNVIDIVCRVLYATQTAAAAAPPRITAGQETAILAAYNASWGTF